MNDFNYELMLLLQQRINNGERLTQIEYKILIELEKYFYGAK